MAYKMTVLATLENDENVMCEQSTVWYSMDHNQMLALEGSFADWLASLSRTIGAGETSVSKKK